MIHLFFASLLGLCPTADLVANVTANRYLADEQQHVRLVAVFPKTARAGCPVSLRIKLVTESEDTMKITFDRIQRGYGMPVVGIDLRDAHGQKVPRTRYAEQCRHVDESSVISPRMGFGASLDLSIPNLARVYDLTIPGEYDITISRFVTLGEGDGKNELFHPQWRKPISIGCDRFPLHER